MQIRSQARLNAAILPRKQDITALLVSGDGYYVLLLRDAHVIPLSLGIVEAMYNMYNSHIQGAMMRHTA